MKHVPLPVGQLLHRVRRRRRIAAGNTLPLPKRRPRSRTPHPILPPGDGGVARIRPAQRHRPVTRLRTQIRRGRRRSYRRRRHLRPLSPGALPVHRQHPEQIRCPVAQIPYRMAPGRSAPRHILPLRLSRVGLIRFEIPNLVPRDGRTPIRRRSPPAQRHLTVPRLRRQVTRRQRRTHRSRDRERFSQRPSRHQRPNLELIGRLRAEVRHCMRRRRRRAFGHTLPMPPRPAAGLLPILPLRNDGVIRIGPAQLHRIAGSLPAQTEHRGGSRLRSRLPVRTHQAHLELIGRPGVQTRHPDHCDHLTGNGLIVGSSPVTMQCRPGPSNRLLS